MKYADLRNIAKKIIDKSQADQTQVSLSLNTEAFSRFNENFIHQNLVRHLTSAQIKVVIDKRIGSITVSDLSKWDKIEDALNQAIAIARMQPQNKHFVSLPKTEQQASQAQVDHKLVDFSALDRAQVIGDVIEYARQNKLEASGTFSISTGQTLIMNSLGLEAYTPNAHGFFRTIMNNGNCTGYTDQVITDMARFTPLELARQAAEKALVCNDPIRIQPGKYTVLLEPVAVADLIRFLGMHTFNGQAVQQKRSYLSDHMGEKIMDPRVTIIDDAHHPLSPHLPFDVEGVVRQRVPLIEKGVACGAVYDSGTAYRYNQPLTGHAGQRGSMPAFMMMQGGAASRSEMIKSIDKGLLITRFHYTGCPEPFKAVATGTSRDGTMWIENGKIVKRINNIRFTQSVIETFNNILNIGNDPRPTRDWWSTFISLLPSLLVRDFNVTGTTTF